jgi:hypothetical protein
VTSHTPADSHLRGRGNHEPRIVGIRPRSYSAGPDRLLILLAGAVQLVNRLRQSAPAAVLALIGALVARAASAQSKPNVVIMLGDNVGYGDIGAYG